MSTHKKSLILGVIWSLIGQIGAMGVNFITNVIIARILTPNEFGQVGIIMFFIILSSVLTDSGLSGAIIRKQNVVSQDYSTVFVFNLLVSLGCYLLLVIFGGMISDYYEDPLLKKLLYVSASVVFINALNIKQQIVLSIEMNYRLISIVRFIATVIGCVVGIVLAKMGYGVWSLVYMQVVLALSNTLILMFIRGFYFSLKFDKKSFQQLYSFGVNTTIASLLNTAFENIYQLIISKVFTMNKAGLYYQAKKLQEVPSNIINLTIQGAVFSFLAKFQEDKREFSKIYNQIILIFTIVMGCITSLIFIYAEQIVLLLYGDKWIGSGLIMKVLCIASFFYLQEMLNRVIFKVFDKTKQILYLELLKKAIQIISILVGIYYKNLLLMLIGFAFTSLISYGINFYSSRKILGVVYWYELIVLIKVVIVACITISILYWISTIFNITGIYKFLLSPVFVVLYLALIQIFGVTSVISEFKKIVKLIKQ